MENIYAALLLHKLGKEISETNLKHVISSAGAQHVDESKIKALITSLKGVDIDKELESASLISAAPAGVAVEEAKKSEEKPHEEKKEAVAEGLSALFG